MKTRTAIVVLVGIVLLGIGVFTLGYSLVNKAHSTSEVPIALYTTGLSEHTSPGFRVRMALDAACELSTDVTKPVILL